MFEMVNEVAVVGTTFFMMAVYTVWYSSLCFQKWLVASNALEGSKEGTKKGIEQIFIVTLLLFVGLYVLAYALVFIPIVPLDPVIFSLAAFLFASVFIVIPAVYENRSRAYIATHLGFAGVYIMGGAYIINNWPW